VASARPRAILLRRKCLRIIVVLLPLFADRPSIPPAGNENLTGDPPLPIAQ
jgi:hypothetical protein